MTIKHVGSAQSSPSRPKRGLLNPKARWFGFRSMHTSWPLPSSRRGASDLVPSAGRRPDATAGRSRLVLRPKPPPEDVALSRPDALDGPVSSGGAISAVPAGRGPLSRTSGRRAPRSRALASWSGARRDGRALRANALALQRFATPLASRGALRLVQGSNRTALAAKS